MVYHRKSEGPSKEIGVIEGGVFLQGILFLARVQVGGGQGQHWPNVC